MSVATLPAYQPKESVKLRVLSLGAGVQSTTMALMAAHGEISPMPDVAIFADTGWEPAAVYEHLRWLASPNVLPFPVHIVQHGNIRDDLISKVSSTGRRFASIPFFTEGGGIGRRQCTKEYKLYPIWRRARELLDLPPRRRPRRGSVEMWVGISTDEAVRMKPAPRQFITNRWPLIELGMSRRDCLSWLSSRGYPEPPKSSCIGCPYHSAEHWRAMKETAPEEWADAVAIDRLIREPGSGFRQRQYMHRQLVPLDEADLSAGQPDDGDLFYAECEGMCGV